MIEFLKQKDISYKENMPLAKLTGMNVQGLLPVVAYPDTIEKLSALYKFVVSRGRSYEVLGGLSNTYLPNNYCRDIVIVTTRVRTLEKVNEENICVGCGYNLTKLSRELSTKSITGYEGFIGIPGTVGAAAINNSSAFNSSMSKVVVSVDILTNGGGILTMYNKDMNYSTRTSVLKEHKIDGIVLSVTLNTKNNDNLENINARIQKVVQIRKEKIDGHRKSLGSIFVATTMSEIAKRHRIAIALKKIVNQPFKLLFHSNKVNTFLDFLFLGKPSLAKHCDSMNRFCWDKGTTEADFYRYINSMQKLAGNKLKLEIDIKK